MPQDKPEIVNAYLDDDGAAIIIHERSEGRRIKRRVPAEYVTWHRQEDLSPEMLRQLKSFEIVRSMRAPDAHGFVRVSWVGHWGRTTGLAGMRANDIESLEGDVDPVTLFLVESGQKIATPKSCYLDLEADSDVSLAHKEDMRILSWAVTDKETGEEFSQVLEEDTDEGEKRLLEPLIKLLKSYDQIAVWEGDWKGGEFDSIVLPARCRKRGLNFDAREWLWLNQLRVWKRMNMHSAETGAEKESFKLEDIAHEHIGEGKEKIPDFVRERWPEKAKRGLGAMTRQLWDAGGRYRKLLEKYNRRDATLLRKLEIKKGYIIVFHALCSVCGILPRSSSLLPTIQMDGFLLRLGRERGYRFATRAYFEDINDDEDEQYRGAFVLPPKTIKADPKAMAKKGLPTWSEDDARQWRRSRGMKNGILRNVHVCDFKSLYPSVMRTWNLSKEVVIGWSKGKNHAPEPGTCVSPGTGLITRLDVEGVIPLALGELLRLREHWSKLAASLPPGSQEWLDAKAISTAYKVAANSFYGAGGSKYSRFYDRDVSEATTQNSVYLIKETMRLAAARNMESVYGDSLTGDRTVVVKDPRGHVRIIPIANLWDETSANYTRVRDTRTRGKDLATPEGWLALTEKGWKPLRRVIRHHVKKPIHMLSTKHGQVRVTRDHSLMVKGQETTPDEFASKGLTFDTVRAPTERPRKRIDLLEYVDHFQFRYTRRGEEQIRRFVADGNWIVLTGGVKSPIRIRRFYAMGEPEWDALLRLVGAYVSDGSASIQGLTTNRSMLSFCKADLSRQKRIATDLRSIFEGASVAEPFWTETVYVVRSGTHAMACLFAALCGWKSRGKRLPAFVYELPEAGYQTLKQSLWDGDGSTDASGAFIFTSISQQLIAGVSYLLSQQGEVHSIHYREEKRAWSLRTRKRKERPSRYSIKHHVEVDFEGDVYDLEVDDAHTFVDGIGRVLLHNTDSAAVIGPSEEGFRAFVKWLNAKHFPKVTAEHGCKTNHVKLSFEKTFDRIVFLASKAYVGRYLSFEGQAAKEDSEPEIKGVAWKRGDKGRLARDLQGRIIDLLVGGVKLKQPSGEKVWINRDLYTRTHEDVTTIAIEGDEILTTDPKGWQPVKTPIEDLAVYRALVERARDHVMAGQLPIEDVRFSKELKKSLREYEKDATEAHVRTARMMVERGQIASRGMRIEFVVVDGSKTPQVVIPAEDYAGEFDRFYLWERVFSPTRSLLHAAFPEEDWKDLEAGRPKKKTTSKKKQVSDQQLGLGLNVPMLDRSSITDGLEELAVAAYKDKPIIVRIPEAAGAEAIDRVRDVLAKHPGARSVEIVIDLASGQPVILRTEMRVSPSAVLLERVRLAIHPSP